MNKTLKCTIIMMVIGLMVVPSTYADSKTTTNFSGDWYWNADTDIVWGEWAKSSCDLWCKQVMGSDVHLVASLSMGVVSGSVVVEGKSFPALGTYSIDISGYVNCMVSFGPCTDFVIIGTI